MLARYAVKGGLSAADLTLLRFAPGGVLLLPLLVRYGLHDLAGIGWPRGLVLALLAGPLFSMLYMTGFTMAPLAHGAVIAPAFQMLSGVGLSAWLARQPLSRASVLGAALVVVGLVCIGGDGLLHSAGGKTPLGDLLFALAGCCWGLFGALSRRWQVDPLRVTSVVVVLSFLAFAPFFAATSGFERLAAAGAATVLLQATAQGLGAGLVAVLAFSRAVALLGSARAAFFGALVPGAAALLAIPVLGEVPGVLQSSGIVAVVAGLLVAFGAVGSLLTRHRNTL